jgi:hypothetical protein
LRERGTYRGVCLALDIATDGAVARGEVVLLETHGLRRTNATVIGIPMSGLNVLTDNGVASGNSIVGDTLVLSSERAVDVLALLAPSAARGADAATVSQFLDEYADRVQVAAILQGPAAASLQSAVTAVLRDRAGAESLHPGPFAAARHRHVPGPAGRYGAADARYQRDRARRRDP